jgi:DHA1 family bicyclomycin/chloramphenicol resistance-like MFS transporter
MKTDKETLGFGETVALMAILISLTALAIDIMLPALPKMGEELRTRHANDAQLVVTVSLR